MEDYLRAVLSRSAQRNAGLGEPQQDALKALLLGAPPADGEEGSPHGPTSRMQIGGIILTLITRGILVAKDCPRHLHITPTCMW